MSAVKLSARENSSIVALLISLTLTISSCGGGNGGGSQGNIVAVNTTPSSATITAGGTQQLTATAVFSNNSTQNVTTSANWSSSNSSVVTVNSAGLVTAVAVGTATISASSGGMSGATTVTVRATGGVGLLSIAVTPGGPTINVGGTQQFRATGSYSDLSTRDLTNTATWASSTPAAATVNSSGLATGVGAGSSVIGATSGSITGSTTLTVAAAGNADLTVDFAARASTQFPIPAGMIGSQLAQLNSQAATNLLSSAGLVTTRINGNVPTVYATRTPDWSKIDPIMNQVKAAGMKALLIIMWTPPWLEPSPNPCADPHTAPPTDFNAWGQMAATYVAHMDQVYPGVVTDYEIWNEPDTQRLCASDQLGTYLQIYAAAAPLMRAQAQADSVNIRIGGPATSGAASDWISALTTNPGTAPNVDFVSFHSYLAGPPEINAGMTWDGAGGTPSLYAKTIDPRSGEMARFLASSAVVRQGIQPNAATTPVYFNEFNDDWSFQNDCCRNSPDFSPVWNGLVMTQLLDSVYSGAQGVPGKIIYFAASAPPFCLLGTINSAMDCSPSSFQPYPQFYLYQLFAGSNFLGLVNGGQMARSMSLSQTATQAGIAATAFYTASADSIVIINPTANDYPQLTVAAQNAGATTGQATRYVLNSSNPQIASSSLSLTASGNGFTTSVRVPPFSVVAISIAAQ